MFLSPGESEVQRQKVCHTHTALPANLTNGECL